MQIEPIAYIHTPMKEKFGIPRQSGLADKLKGYIEFTEKYRDPNALDGIEGYDYIWLLWEFEGVQADGEAGFRAKVRPPRLGGNEYVGVFATRSPFRPNPIGLSCVKLEKIEIDAHGYPVIYVLGADLRDGTPIYDIKPYLPYVDAHPDARGGFTDTTRNKSLEVCFCENYLDDAIAFDERELFIEEKQEGLIQILSQDPRPAYQEDEKRIYGMRYYDYEVKFTVEGEKVIVHKCSRC